MMDKKPDGYPDQANITNRDSILDFLNKLEGYYLDCAGKATTLLTKLKESEIGPGRPAVHREFGNCFVTKIWPKVKEGKLQCAITYTPKDNANSVQLQKIYGRRSSIPGSAVVDISELMPYNEMSKTLYEE
jgi:hypothetical protein